MSDTSVPRSRKPRMVDIAARSAVSIGTVSRVLNEKADVDPALAERVKQAARELGYALRSGNRQAEARGASVGSIAYLLDRSTAKNLTNAFQQHFLSGIEQRANELDHHILYTSCADEIEQNKLPSIIANKTVRGAIIKGTIPDAWIEQINAIVPTVLLMSHSLSRAIPSVICDNIGATYQLLRYLRDLGHRRIGFIYEKELNNPSAFHSLEREAAFRKYIDLLGLEFLPEYIQTPMRSQSDVVQGEDVTSVMTKGLKNMLALGDKRPTAVIGSADVYALSLMRAATSLGLSVPRDLSVAGYMNTDVCEYASPPLTSVCLSAEEIGRAAVDLLESRIKAPASLVRHIVVAPRLVERLSCAPPRSA